MAKDGGSDITSILLMVGGAAAAYWYITSYGPNGAVSAGNVSWWTTWFGAGTAPASTVTASPPTSTGTSAGTGTGTGTETGTPPASATGVVPPPITLLPTPTPVVQVPANFTVAPDINNALKGTILYNGVPATLDVILSNAGNTSGVVWNSQGQDVTAVLGPTVVAQIVQAFQAQANIQAAQTISGVPIPTPFGGVSGIVPAFQSKAGPGLGQGIPSMSFGKGFGSGFSNRRKSTPPLRQLLN
jgi:hypothetical protein